MDKDVLTKGKMLHDILLGTTEKAQPTNWDQILWKVNNSKLHYKTRSSKMTVNKKLTTKISEYENY